MPTTSEAPVRHAQQVDVAESMRCAAVDKPGQARRHKREMVRYLLLVAAFIAVVFLVSIALYYTQATTLHGHIL